MDLALGIAAGLGTMGVAIFLTMAVWGFVLRITDNMHWWSAPAWIALSLCLGVPMALGSIALGLIAFSRVSGVPL